MTQGTSGEEEHRGRVALPRLMGSLKKESLASVERGAAIMEDIAEREAHAVEPRRRARAVVAVRLTKWKLGGLAVAMMPVFGECIWVVQCLEGKGKVVDGDWEGDGGGVRLRWVLGAK